ncbi:uncharacterized protein RCC_02320 [Ramularia collo-cygni]|uniref:F-box domain-containing protein n=1 Tax=Ramularia collo-cygni TaxID=112498 RepID=A0A2D3UWA3_9PEZI|nr:uncharacterized protein RCC_02320 [Ramularia collo-cygni]CZT16477.1 uncharacterized protein RCC_02320 [Ramularia collo-cygni]
MHESVQASPAAERSRGTMQRQGTTIAGPSHDPSPRSSSRARASNKVFGTTELLEDILLHLPLQDILKMQRVSKLSNAVIKSSPKIQRVIFFTPHTELVSKAPLTDPDFGPKYKQGIIATMIFQTTAGLVRPGHYTTLFRDSAASTWRQHSISQPPCTHIRYQGAIDGETHTVSNPNGVTFGDVFDAVKKCMPVLDRERKMGPMKGREPYMELPKEVTGWDVQVLLKEVLDEVLHGDDELGGVTLNTNV